VLASPLIVCVLVASVLVRFLVCLLHSLVALLAGGPGVPGGPGWQSCWSLSFPPPPLRPLPSNPSLPPVLLRAPVPRECPRALCAEPAVRRHLPFVSLSPRTLSREPCRPPLPLPSPVCWPARGRRAREPSCAYSSSLSPPALDEERSGCTLNQHTHDRLLCVAFPRPVIPIRQRAALVPGAITTVALSFLAAETPCTLASASPPPGGLNDARCLLLLHHSRPPWCRARHTPLTRRHIAV